MEGFFYEDQLHSCFLQTHTTNHGTVPNPGLIILPASKLFPTNWHYKPWDITKPQSYYSTILSTILETTRSVKLKHFKLHHHPEPRYTTCTIQKIIHPSDCKQPLHKSVTFLIPNWTPLHKSKHVSFLNLLGLPTSLV